MRKAKRCTPWPACSIFTAALLVLIVGVPSFAASDAEIITATKLALSAQRVEAGEIEVVDERSSGGEKTMIISYVESAGTEIESTVRIFTVLTIAYGINSQLNGEIGAVVAVIGSQSGESKARITVKVNDLEGMLKKRTDAITFVKSWEVSLQDKNFLPSTAAKMGW